MRLTCNCPVCVYSNLYFESLCVWLQVQVIICCYSVVMTIKWLKAGHYQIHHHVDGADFVWVHLVQHLLHLLKCGPQGEVIRPALLDELQNI